MQDRNLYDLDFNVDQIEQVIVLEMNSGDADDNADDNAGASDDSKDDGDKNINDPKAANFSRSRKSFCC